jgi:hypothetical protein
MPLTAPPAWPACRCRTLCLFHMGMQAVLTILVNGSTTRLLLRVLGQLKTTPEKAAMVQALVEVGGGPGAGLAAVASMLCPTAAVASMLCAIAAVACFVPDEVVMQWHAASCLDLRQMQQGWQWARSSQRPPLSSALQV